MNSVFDNNGIYGAYGNGMMYAQPQQKEIAWTNALTQEEEKSLHQGKSGISIDIPKEDIWRAKCTHRDPKTRSFTVVKNNDGTVTCMKCGATFNLVDNVDIDQVKKIIGGCIDILQTMKLSYVNMPPEVVQSYFIILPFLEIAPQLFEAAMHTVSNVCPNVGVTGNYAPNDMFNSYYAALGNVGMINPAMAAGAVQPMMMGANNMVQPQFMNAPIQGQVPAYANPMQTQQPVYNMPGVAETVTNPQPAPPLVQNQNGDDKVVVSKQFQLN